MVLERLSWYVTCLNHASFCLLTVAKRGPLNHKEADLALHPVVGLVLQVEDAEKFAHAFGVESLDRFFFCCCFFQSVSRVHVSQPQRRMQVTRELYNLNLLLKLVLLHRQILLNLATAAIAEANLTRISAEQVPFLHRVALTFLKLVTSSFWPFMLTSTSMLFVLLVMVLRFSVLTSMPYVVALSTSLWMMSKASK